MNARASLLLSIGLLLLAPATPARAEDTPRRMPLAITVSGGVSLGSYEAGFQFYALEMARLNPSVFDLRLVAGASAGSLNAFLTILSYCGKAGAWPEQSLFWQSWIPLGYQRMFVPNDTTATGMFSRRFGETVSKAYLEEWERGASQACDIVFGVTTTRLIPRTMMTAGGKLPLPQSEEKFIVRVTAAGKGARLRATNYLDPEYRVPQAMLPVAADGSIAFESLRDLIYASMSFPIAFSPQPVAHCLTKPGEPPHCTKANARTEPFIDGGVFDNVPLRLAAKLMGSGLRTIDGAIGWLPHPRFAEHVLPSHARFLFLSPDATDYPLFEEESTEIPGALLSFVWQFANTFISTARNKNLYSIIEERPELAKLILVPQRHYPAASGLLGAFFGFFETDFRIFDFYLGMYDARRSFDASRDPKLPPLAYPELVYLPGDDARNPVGGWAAFQCMRGTYDSLPELAAHCRGDRMAQFRILLQVAIERLYENCARLGDKDAETDNGACKAAMRGVAPPTIPDVATKPGKPTDWRRRADESELHHALRLLARHGFVFRDLGVGRGDGDRAMIEIRRLLGAALDKFVRAQPPKGRALIQLVGQVAADYLAYAPPRHLVWFLIGRQFELGWSLGDPHTTRLRSSLRFNLGLLFDGVNRVTSSDRRLFGLGLAGGLEIQPYTLSNGFIQPRIVLRLGYMFSANDRFTRDPCTAGAAEALTECSRFVTQLQVGATLLGRLRLQLLAEWYPSLRAGQKTLWSLTPEVGVQFPF